MTGKCKATVVVALALMLLWGGLALAGTQETLQQADAAYAQRAQAAQAQRAVELYGQALAADPKCLEAAWKLSRAWYWVGSHTPEDKALEPFEKAVEAGKKAVAIDPESIQAHFWLGVAYGSYGKAKGIMKSLSLVDPIKEEMALVIKKDPKFEAGGAYRVLGRLYFKLPGLFGGDNDKAIENLKTAVQHGPQRWLNHIYLAEVYIKEDLKPEARKLLQEVVAGPAEAGLEAEYADWKAEAQKLLAGMK